VPAPAGRSSAAGSQPAWPSAGVALALGSALVVEPGGAALAPGLLLGRGSATLALLGCGDVALGDLRLPRLVRIGGALVLLRDRLVLGGAFALLLGAAPRRLALVLGPRPLGLRRAALASRRFVLLSGSRSVGLGLLAMTGGLAAQPLALALAARCPLPEREHKESDEDEHAGHDCDHRNCRHILSPSPNTPPQTRSLEQTLDGVRSTESRPTYDPEPRATGWFFWGLLRLAMGWIFLWAFLDKMFGLGFATGRDPKTGAIDFGSPDAWINGGSPTEGFLSFGLHTKEPFTGWYSDLAGQGWVDWIYMVSMAAIGILLILGILTRPAAIAGIVWMVLFYTASAIWPENNPFLDDHLVYAIVLAGIAYVGAGRYLGLGRWWERTGIARRFPILR